MFSVPMVTSLCCLKTTVQILKTSSYFWSNGTDKVTVKPQVSMQVSACEKLSKCKQAYIESSVLMCFLELGFGGCCWMNAHVVSQPRVSCQGLSEQVWQISDHPLTLPSLVYALIRFSFGFSICMMSCNVSVSYPSLSFSYIFSLLFMACQLRDMWSRSWGLILCQSRILLLVLFELRVYEICSVDLLLPFLFIFFSLPPISWHLTPSRQDLTYLKLSVFPLNYRYM